jgi:hypothetical protein
MGGPPVYLAVKGTVCLTDVHAPYAIGPDERDQWLYCMDRALECTGDRDRTEIGGQLSFDYVSFQADEVFFGDQTVNIDFEPGSQASIASNIVSLDRTAAGLGDVRLYMRNRLTPIGRAVVATHPEA